MTTASCVFEDRFLVRSVDSSKFERVSRLSAKSTGFDAELLLDVNSDLLQVSNKAVSWWPSAQMLHILITNSLLPSGSDVNLSESVDVPSLLGDYEYAMYGKIFKFEDVSSETRTIYASFGGLLMSLTADKQVVADLDLDMKIYLLVRRISPNR